MELKKKILCVEDDTFLLDLISGRLKHIVGLTVVGAHTGTEGLVAAKSEQPNLILLDLMLPDIRGSEVMRLIKEDPKLMHIPVIIFSNLGDKDEIEKSLAHGARAYLVKSSTLPSELVGVVAKELGLSDPQIIEETIGEANA